MATYTTRNSLTKPAYTDAADVGVINTNMDTIDASFAKCNWAAAAAPTVNDDSGDGYAIGSFWFDTTGHGLYIAEVVTVGAAVWRTIYPQGSSAHTSTNAPTVNDDTTLGYSIGSLWVRTTTGYVYIATDVTTGAAVWRVIYPEDHGVLVGLGDDDHTQYLLAAGTRALSGDWDAGSYEVRAQTFESDVTTGTAPFTIASTTVSTNLNADLLDGLHDTAFVKQTLADAKGDLIVGSGADAWAKLTVGTDGYYLKANSGATNGIEWAAASSGAAFWTAMPGTPTFIDGTSFSIDDASNANHYELVFSKGTLIYWTESSTWKVAMITKATYDGSDDVVFDIVGNTMSSIDSSSLKYCIHKAEFTEFIIPGSIPNSATSDVSRTFYAPFDLYPLQAEGWHKTAGTTNSTVYDINDDSTTIFNGAAVTIATTATTNIDADDRGNPAYTPGTVVAKSSLVTVDIVSASTTNPVDAYIRFWYMPQYYRYRS